MGWLSDEMAHSAAEWASLPPLARPVVVAPLQGSLYPEGMTSISPGGPDFQALRDEIRAALDPWYSSSRITMKLAVGEAVQWIISRYELVPRAIQPPPGYVPSRDESWVRPHAFCTDAEAEPDCCVFTELNGVRCQLPAAEHEPLMPGPVSAEAMARVMAQWERPLAELYWAPYQEFGIPDPEQRQSEPPSFPFTVGAIGYQGDDITVYWEALTTDRSKGEPNPTRVEVIDHRESATPAQFGMAYSCRKGITGVDLAYQDGGRTLKIFLR